MKYNEVKKYKIIYDRSASGFEKKLNDAIADLSEHHPEITISEQRPTGFLAYLTYTESTTIPEDVGDELKIRGLQITCGDCPYLQRTNDNRRKKFRCEFAPYKLTYTFSPACNKFYEDLIQMFLACKETESTKQLIREIPDIPESTK